MPSKKAPKAAAKAVSQEEPSPWDSLPEALVGLVKDERFLEKLDAWLREWRASTTSRQEAEQKLSADREKNRRENEKERLEKWYEAIEKAFWGRMILSGLVLAAMTYLANQGKIDPPVVAALFTAVVASLFVQPRKD